MNRQTVVERIPAAALGALVLALGWASTGGLARAQTSSGAEEAGMAVEVTARDHEAARNVVARGIHTAGTGHTDGARNAPKTFKINEQGALVEISRNGSSTTRIEAAVGAATPAVPGFSGPGFYPDDLVQNVPAGPVLTNALFYNVFINCDGMCFVTPGQSATPGIFLNRWFPSTFIHVLDQYTGTTQSGRYSGNGRVLVQYTVQSAQLDDATDIAAVVHAAAASHGSGYNAVYNVFVPKGIDVCISTSTGPQCFSPNNPANWFFCAYHSYVDFSDIGHVLYTVIPYPDQALVSGGLPFYVCDVGQTNPNSNTAPTPNGVVSDSVASLLDHEISETITDPDINAYQVQNSLADYLSEIGDICVNPGYLYAPVTISGFSYYIQPEYSNTYHACVTVP